MMTSDMMSLMVGEGGVPPTRNKVHKSAVPVKFIGGFLSKAMERLDSVKAANGRSIQNDSENKSDRQQTNNRSTNTRSISPSRQQESEQMFDATNPPTRRHKETPCHHLSPTLWTTTQPVDDSVDKPVGEAVDNPVDNLEGTSRTDVRFRPPGLLRRLDPSGGSFVVPF